jgi:hypothetical protein
MPTSAIDQELSSPQIASPVLVPASSTVDALPVLPTSLSEQHVDIPAPVEIPLTAQTALLTPPPQENTSAVPTPQSQATTAPRVTALSYLIYQYGRRKLLITGGIITLILVVISAGTLYALTRPVAALSGKRNVSTTTNIGSGTNNGTPSTDTSGQSQGSKGTTATSTGTVSTTTTAPNLATAQAQASTTSTPIGTASTTF